MSTLEAARGKWRQILSSFGLDEKFLRNRHGPCPLCKGKDRYRFDDKDGTGSYYCSGCGSGYGFTLLKKWSGKESKELMKQIDAMIGNLPNQIITPKQDPRIRIEAISEECLPVMVSQNVIQYLHARKLRPTSGLFAIQKMKYFDDGKMVAEFDAMVAPFLSVDGEILTYHATYVQNGAKAPVQSPRKIFTPISKMDGGAIRLTKLYKQIGIAEGIETALAVMRDFKIPCWAASSAGMMEKFVPPAGVESVSIFGDNDESFTGQKAAYILANRLKLKGIDVKVFLPTQIGDFADEK